MSATICECGLPLETPVEMATSLCLPCHLGSSPPHRPSALGVKHTAVSAATTRALMAKHHAIQVAMRGQSHHYDPREADRNSDDGPPRVDAGVSCAACGAGIARDDTTCSGCRADVREAS